MTDHTDATSSTAAAREHPDARVALRRLQRLIRVRLAEAVTDDGLDLNLANDMLEACDLPYLPRHWSVRLSLRFTAGLIALTAEDAYDAIADAIEKALDHASIPINIDWDRREPHGAILGDIDHTALDDTLMATATTTDPFGGALPNVTAPQNTTDSQHVATDPDLPYVVEVEYPSTAMRSLYGPLRSRVDADDFAVQAERVLADPEGQDDTPNVSVVVINPPTLRNFAEVSSSHEQGQATT